MKTAIFAALALALAACPGPSKAPEPPHVEDPPPGDEPPTSFEIQDNHLILPAPVVFQAGSYELDIAASQDTLDYILAFLNAKADVTKVRIEGHTDGEIGGDDEVMMSGARASEVGFWLRDHGVACTRILIGAFGDSMPVADDATPEGKAQNRRIEVVVAELRGNLIGGMPAEGSALVTAPDVCE